MSMGDTVYQSSSYQEWKNYIRLMERAWNTTFHSVLKCTPFEAAHGLPARSAIDSVFNIYGLGTQPVKPMSPNGVAAMRTTAEAFVQQVIMFDNPDKRQRKRTQI